MMRIKPCFLSIVLTAILTLTLAHFTAAQSSKPPEDYYNELANKCKNNGCCHASVKAMKSGNYKLAPEKGCPRGSRRARKKCIDSYTWCEPEVFRTQEECEQTTEKECGFQTHERKYKEGWVAR